MSSFISVPLLRSEKPAARMDAIQEETAERRLPVLDLRTRTLCSEAHLGASQWKSRCSHPTCTIKACSPQPHIKLAFIGEPLE